MVRESNEHRSFPLAALRSRVGFNADLASIRRTKHRFSYEGFEKLLDRDKQPGFKRTLYAYECVPTS